MEEEANRDFIQSIERCMAVITAFTDREAFMSFTELSAATGLSKPTVRRILLTLQHLGYGKSVGTRFGLTPKILSLGYAYLSSLDITKIAQPVMESLTDEIKESTALVALDGTEVVYVNRVHRHRISSITLAVGTRLPAHATSSGHVLLADLSASALAEYFEKADLRAMTGRTLTSTDALQARLQQVRAQGWDAVDQELEIGRRSAAAPIRDSSGKVIAALSFSCSATDPSFADMLKTYLAALQQAAETISRVLGADSHLP